MSTRHVTIASPIARTADLSALAGLSLALRAGAVKPGADLLIEEDRTRPLSELAAVAADGIGRHGRRIEYRMLNGVRREADSHLADLPLRYELTAMHGRPIGSEAAKTAGHVHVRPPRCAIGYPEVVEVLHGEAGFLIQDLVVDGSGARSTRAWLVRARPGDRVTLPPDLAHATIDLGAGPLVFSDVIDRRAQGIYSGVAAARGFGWYVGADGRLRPNPRYARPPRIEEVAARDWSAPARGPLYRAFRDDPDSLAWLSQPERFSRVAPDLWQRVSGYLPGES